MTLDSILQRVRAAAAATALGLATSFSVGAETATSIEAALDDAVATGEVLSGFGAVVGDDEAHYFGAGRLGPEQGPAPSATTSYQIGSISKAFTNLLLAEMVAAGAVDYDTTVAALVGDDVDFANPAVGEITLGELATHTSGLPRLPANMTFEDPADPYRDYDADKLLAAVAATRAKQPLGDHYAYSNFGLGLLGHLLGRADGRGYQRAMQARVLEPLGLDETGFEPATPPAAAWAGGEAVPAWAFDALAGAGALWSTTRDMARLARIQLEAEPRALEHEIDAEREIVAPAKAGYAVTRVWHVAETPDGPVFWHNGATAGHRSFFGFRPATGQAVVLLAAGEIDPAGLALDWFGFSPSAQEAVEIDPAIEGQYRLSSRFGIGVYSGDSGPVAQMTGQSPAPMTAIGDGWYALSVADASLRFVREDGEVTAVELVQNGRTRRAEKVADTAAVLEREPVELDRDALRDYVGEYALGAGPVFTIRLGDEGLEARLTGQPFLRIHPRGDDVFFYRAVDAELHFERDADGRVEALVLHQGGIEQRAERVR